jgi:hypothetical protein
MPRTLTYLAALTGLIAAAAAVATAPVAAAQPAARGGTVSALATSASFRSTGCAEGKVAIARKAVVGYGSGRICLRLSEGPERDSRVDPLYSRVATEVIAELAERTGREPVSEVMVVCWGSDDWRELGSATLLGYVYIGNRVVNLAPSVCRYLDRISYRGAQPGGYMAATAVDTLAHEAIHVAGIRNEARAECFAMQLTRFTSEQLGTSAGYGAALTRSLWEGYEEYGASNPEYYSSACRNGGPLDLNPEDPFFWP